jgi:short-subunit dehydrogenase
MSESYRSKKVVITGGSSGIGLALANALAAEGAHLFIVARKNSLLDSIAIDLKTRHRACEVDLILIRYAIRRPLLEVKRQLLIS